jgi:hypothetical protein
MIGAWHDACRLEPTSKALAAERRSLIALHQASGQLQLPKITMKVQAGGPPSAGVHPGQRNAEKPPDVEQKSKMTSAAASAAPQGTDTRSPQPHEEDSLHLTSNASVTAQSSAVEGTEENIAARQATRAATAGQDRSDIAASSSHRKANMPVQAAAAGTGGVRGASGLQGGFLGKALAGRAAKRPGATSEAVPQTGKLLQPAQIPGSSATLAEPKSHAAGAIEGDIAGPPRHEAATAQISSTDAAGSHAKRSNQQAVRNASQPATAKADNKVAGPSKHARDGAGVNGSVAEPLGKEAQSAAARGEADTSSKGAGPQVGTAAATEVARRALAARSRALQPPKSGTLGSLS